MTEDGTTPRHEPPHVTVPANRPSKSPASRVSRVVVLHILCGISLVFSAFWWSATLATTQEVFGPPVAVAEGGPTTSPVVGTRTTYPDGIEWLFILAFGMAVLHIMAAFALHRRRRWARGTAIAMSIVSGAGPVLGWITLVHNVYVLTRPSTKAWLRGSTVQMVPQASPSPEVAQ